MLHWNPFHFPKSNLTHFSLTSSSLKSPNECFPSNHLALQQMSSLMWPHKRFPRHWRELSSRIHFSRISFCSTMLTETTRFGTSRTSWFIPTAKCSGFHRQFIRARAPSTSHTSRSTSRRASWSLDRGHSTAIKCHSPYTTIRIL